MEAPLALYCKSFRDDLDRARILLRSISRFNVDGIPLYMSAPREDLSLFQNAFASEATVLCDDQVVDRATNPRMSGWRDQQVLKLAFAETGIAVTYVVLDSDTFFLKPFRRTDFVNPDGKPYVVASPLFARYRGHDKAFTRILFGESDPPPPPSPAVRIIGTPNIGNYDRTKPWSHPHDAKKTIGALLGVEEVQSLTYMPPPVVIHSPFLLDMRDRYLRPHEITWRDLIAIAPWEFIWYGMWALREHAEEVHPRHPYFALFGTDAEIQSAVEAGVKPEVITRRFFGAALGGVRHQKHIAFWPP